VFISNNIKKLRLSISSNVTLVAVSKTKSIADIKEAYLAGQRDFGENKVQEMAQKYDELPKDIRWHMIGHLQSNKIKYMAHFVHLIHGVDSMELLQEIDKHAKKNNRVINCLLQVHIAQEETKFGLYFDEIKTLLNSKNLSDLQNIKIVGLMGMASFTEDETQIITEFKALNTLFLELSNLPKADNFQMEILSMGMSGDYKIAIQEGSNMVRIGSAIFGERNYIAQ
jgi:pyridoxal phosphate enzyme (YggS family)